LLNSSLDKRVVFSVPRNLGKMLVNCKPQVEKGGK